jgi:hypothetical protein
VCAANVCVLAPLRARNRDARLQRDRSLEMGKKKCDAARRMKIRMYMRVWCKRNRCQCARYQPTATPGQYELSRRDQNGVREKGAKVSENYRYYKSRCFYNARNSDAG